MSDESDATRPTIIPRVFVDDPGGLVEFVREVFDADGDFAPGRPTEIRIGSSILMVSGTDDRAAANAFLYAYVPDVDATFQRAVERDATTVEEPTDQFYGDRRGMIIDPWGNTWQIATPTS